MKIFITVTLLELFFILTSCDDSLSLNCTKVPQITIKVSSSNGLSIKSLNEIENEITIEPNAQVEILCSSSEPLHMDFKGEMVHSFDDDIKRRRMSNYSNPNSYCFDAILKFTTSDSATGNYSCGTISRRKVPSSLTSVYIFVNNGSLSDAHLLNARKCITTGEVPENFSLIIPCVSTNNNSQPTLYRAHYENCGDFNGNGPLDLEEKLPYDPKKGFIIDTKTTENCWTKFVCVLGDEKLGVDAIKPKDFRATPSEGTIVYQQTIKADVVNYSKYARLKLICESRYNVTFVNKIKEKDLVYIQYSHKPGNYYEYSATLTYSGDFNFTSESNTSTVSCVSTRNQKIIHWTWTIVHKNLSDKTGLFYDEEKKSFMCYSATVGPTVPNLRLIHCANSLNCASAQRFIANNKTEEIDFPFTVSDVGYPCRNKPAHIYSGCKEFPVQIGESHGMAHCQTGDYHYFSIYYTNLKGKIVALFSNIAKNGSQTDVVLEKIKRIVYVNETVSFTCKASRLRFSLGIQVAAELCTTPHSSSMSSCILHGYQFPENATLEVKESTENQANITLNIRMRIWSTEIKGFRCSAPVLTSKEWISVDESLTVEDGEYPTIKSLENVQGKLRCSATGDPLPDIKWGTTTFQPQQKDITHTIENNTIGNTTILVRVSTLTFPNVSGDYFCVATNPKGSTQRMIAILDDSFPIAYTAGTIAAILLLLGLIFILIRNLRKQKRAIEKLTEAEIMEFENGNETMMHHASELNEIAQYLPYNQDFEIPEKKLELIDEDLLGSGAFGVVLKGYVEKEGEKYAVAIKTIKSHNNLPQLKKLLAELKIMMYIGRHVNIIYLIGAQTRKLREGKVCVIVEYCALGNLQTFLRENRRDFVNQVVNDQIDAWIMPRTKSMKQNRNALTKLPECPIVYKSKRFSQQLPSIRTLDLVNWCYQLANGMEYLETKKVIHGDLATRNLLLSEDWTLKITDFGLSRHMYEYTNYIKKQKEEPLPWRWLSVEAIRDSKFSTMSDVWAFGVTAWEIFTMAEVPYPGFSWGEEFVRALSKGYRMSKPQYATTDLYNMISECWKHELTERPNFKVLKEYFQQILETYSNSTEKILEAFLGPEPFNFDCKYVQTNEDNDLL